MGLAAELHLPAAERSLLGRSPVGRSIRWFAATRGGARISALLLSRLDRAALALTGGRFTIANGPGGVPTLFLTTRGARSGQPRTVQLIAVPAGDDLAVIGSNFGGRDHPAWVHNLTADPRAVAGYRDRRVEVIARELTGLEAEPVWAAARALNRGFTTYPGLAGSREIRVFRLEPVSRPG